MLDENLSQLMSTERALKVAAHHSARRSNLLSALAVLAEDQEANRAEGQTHFPQTQSVRRALNALVPRILGMGGEHAEAARRILRSRASVQALFPALVAADDIPSGKIHGCDIPTRRPTLFEIMSCMASEGGSADGFDPDYVAWVQDNADPKRASRARKILDENPPIELSLR